MNRKRDLINLLLQSKRVDLNSSNYRQITKIILAALFFFSIGITLWTMSNLRLTFSIIFAGGMISGIIASAVFYFYSHIKGASLKGDMLILHSLNKKSKVTSLRSIRKIKTKTFLGIQLTDMTYHLDGLNKRALIFTLANRVPATPEHSIKKAIDFSIKSIKEKANHKPGSVSAA